MWSASRTNGGLRPPLVRRLLRLAAMMEAAAGMFGDAGTLLVRATASQGSSVLVPRVLLVFAHPDDESIGLGARLGRLASGRCVHATDGAPRNGADSRAHGFDTVDAYRRARAEELRSAMIAAGAAAMRREALGIPDQEAALNLVELTRALVRILTEEACDVVFTHPYEGGHPDHDACAFAVHRAVSSLRAQRRQAPLVAECAFYHRGPNGHESGVFLDSNLGGARTTEVVRDLSSAERQRKTSILRCFATQRQTIGLFSVDRESFRIAPDYDFHRPAHPGPAYCDLLGWGTTSADFCDLARRADRGPANGAAC
jgi:LmbE family N-acetylglucosaminyl deacetylase